MRLKEISKPESVKIDNERGWGATPQNSDIDYFGARVGMRPSKFLKLATPLPRDSAGSVDDLKEHILHGGAIGSPTLSIVVPDSWHDGKFGDHDAPPYVMSHEGRNRMYAILEVFGDTPVETHIILFSPNKSWRARNITLEILDRINHGILNEQRVQLITGPLFNK